MRLEEVPVGVERAVTRWYVRRHALLAELATLQERLAQLALPAETRAEEGNAAQQAERAAVERQQAEAQARLDALGPCPKPMMG